MWTRKMCSESSYSYEDAYLQNIKVVRVYALKVCFDFRKGKVADL